jgi:DNA repair protein RecO (recombination protein O)
VLIRVQGVIIRSMDYGEGGKIVTLLTETHGKTGVLIRGASKPRSRYGSLALPFTYGEFVFFKGSGLGTLSSGEIIRSHHKLRENIDLAAHASYVAELTDRALQDEEAGNWIFSQLIACLAALEDGKDAAITTHVYEMKILQAAGYAPVLDRCVSCGRTDGLAALAPVLGGAVCPACRAGGHQVLQLGDKALKLLRLFAAVDLRRLGEVNVGPETKAAVRRGMRALVDAHLPHKLKSRAFLDSLDALGQPPIRPVPDGEAGAEPHG